MTDKVYSNITVVDESDNLIGYMQLPEAIELGQIRRVIYVLVINSQKEFLIQRRGKNVINPHLLDASASGHVDEGDTYETAAKRELEEELGIIGVDLQLLTEPFYTPGFYNGVFVARISEDNILPSTEEVDEILWVTWTELIQETQNPLSQFTPEFIRVFEKVCDKIKI